jgi:hypothetical protein
VVFGAERGQRINAVEVPSAFWRIPPVMDFQAVGGVAEAASVPVAIERQLPQLLPLWRSDILLVIQPLMSFERDAKDQNIFPLRWQNGASVSSAIRLHYRGKDCARAAPKQQKRGAG